MEKEERRLRLFVARCAATQFNKLPASEQRDLLEAFTLILPNDEAEMARQTLFYYRRAERQQMELFDSLT